MSEILRKSSLNNYWLFQLNPMQVRRYLWWVLYDSILVLRTVVTCVLCLIILINYLRRGWAMDCVNLLPNRPHSSFVLGSLINSCNSTICFFIRLWVIVMFSTDLFTFCKFWNIFFFFSSVLIDTLIGLFLLWMYLLTSATSILYSSSQNSFSNFFIFISSYLLLSTTELYLLTFTSVTF